MAIIHLSGTRLEPEKGKAPLNRKFMFAFGFIFIIAMHVFMPNPGGSGIAISFNATCWIGISFALAIGLYQLANNQKVRYSKLTIGLLISGIIISLPLLYPNANIQAVLPRLGGLWAGFLMFLLLQQFRLSNKYKQQLLWFIVIATLIESLFGYVQFFILQPGNIFGYNPLTDRPYGIFQQPNVMASFLATGLVLSGYLLGRQQRKYGRKASQTVLLYLIPSITLPLIVVLASRTGWIGAATAVVIMLPYLYRFSTKKRLIGWSLSLVVGISAGLLITTASENTTDRVMNKIGLQSARLSTFPQALDMLIEKPFTGYGYGRFESAYIIYSARQHQLNPSYPAGLQGMDHPHNEMLFWGVEGGVVPLIGIMLAASFVLLKMYSARKGTRLAMLGLFVPIVLHTQLEYPFYHSVIHWMVFVVLIFWVDQRTANYRLMRFSRLTRVSLKIVGLLLPLFVTVYMVTALHTNYVLTQYEKSSPRDPEILDWVSNPFAWKDRFDWDIYSTYLELGLTTCDPTLIKPYIEWSQKIIKEKPRAALYTNLILAYLAMGEESKAEQIRTEAEFLFPARDFSDLKVEIVPQKLMN